MASTATAPTTLSTTFDDEFNSLVSSADGSVGWMTRLPYGGEAARDLYPNHEAEYYSDSSVGEVPFSISNGVLSITASAAASGSNPYKLPYDSGIITTKYSFGQLYGYFDVRAELPAGAGLWPAWWFKPVDGTTTTELDAFEVLGNDPTKMYFTIHDRSSGTDVTEEQVVSVANTSTAFHTYGVDWEPATVTFYIDGVAVATLKTPASMDKPMYMLLNLAVGGTGSWPGAPTSSSEFPAAYKIDYVRAYATANTTDVTGTDAVTSSSTSTSAPATGSTATGSTATTSATFTLRGTGASAVRGAGHYTVTGTVNQGSLTLGAGNDTVRLVGYNNAVSVGTGDSLIKLDGGTNTIQTDGGDITIVASGTYNTISLTNGGGDITAGAGHDTVQLNGHISATNATGGDFAVQLSGAYNTVTAVALSLTVAGGSGSSSFLFASDAPAEAIYAASNGAARIYNVTSWGSWNVFKLIDSAQNTVITGSGAAIAISDPASSKGKTAGSFGLAKSSFSLHGLNNHLVDTGLADLTVTGGTGQGAFILGNGDDTLTTGGIDNTITAGSGKDTIVAGGGNDTVVLNGTNVAATLSGTGDKITFSNGASGGVDDKSQGLHLYVDKSTGPIDLQNFANDAKFILDLVGGAGGYTTAAQAAAAVYSDGDGGSILALGTGSLHFEGFPVVAASAIRIG